VGERAGQSLYADFERVHEDYMDAHPDLKPYIARAGEIAIRLATIRAAGRWGPDAGIDLSDMEWGAGISWTAGRSAIPRNRTPSKQVNMVNRLGAAPRVGDLPPSALISRRITVRQTRRALPWANATTPASIHHKSDASS
jgi:hypothetical protein